MKNMKKQLFTAVAMLLVATVALGTATYAWFVNNATGNVETMNFTASSSTSMQIALGTGGTWTTADGTKVPHGFTAPTINDWKGLITTKDIRTLYGFKDLDNGAFAPFLPASTVDDVHANGFYQVSVWDDATRKATTFSAIDDFRTADGASNFTNASVLAIPLYLKSSADMPVYLNNKTEELVTVNDAKYDAVKGAVRVAFVATTSKGAILDKHILQDSTTHANNRGNTTNLSTPDAAREDIGIISTKGAIGTQTVKEWTSYEVNANAEGTFAGDTSGKNALFTLPKDETIQVMTYVWLEGCDWDCVTDVSNMPFNVNLHFIGKEPTNP